jgi:hypothetical protein
MRKRVEYKLSLREGYPPETRKGHLVTLQSHGFPPVDLVLYRSPGGWKVDHPRSGLSVHELDQVVLFGKGPTLAQAKQDLQAGFVNLGFAERFAKAPARAVLNSGFK